MNSYEIRIVIVLMTIVIICIVLLLILGLIKKKIDSRKLNQIVQDITSLLQKHNAQCCLLCQYLSGINHIVKDTLCYIFADNNEISFVFIGTSQNTYTIEISKLLSFNSLTAKPQINTYVRRNHDLYENEKLIYMVSIEYTDQSGNNSQILLSYDVVKNLKTKIYFDPKTSYYRDEQLFNTQSLKLNNIFDYVDSRIPKQTKNIHL